MTSKQYLRKIGKARRRIEKLTLELEERRTRLTSISPPQFSERVQSSQQGDRFADMIAALADTDLKRQQLIFLYEMQRDQIVDEILGLESDLYSELLYRRYVREQSLERIAADLSYSYDRIRHAHGDALIAFAKKYPDRLKDDTQ